MSRMLKWWSLHTQGVCLTLAVVLAAMGYVTHKAITHCKMMSTHYQQIKVEHDQIEQDAALMRFLLIEKACSCKATCPKK